MRGIDLFSWLNTLDSWPSKESVWLLVGEQTYKHAESLTNIAVEERRRTENNEPLMTNNAKKEACLEGKSICLPLQWTNEMNHGMSVKLTIVPLIFLLFLYPPDCFAFSSVTQRSGKHLHSTESKVTVKGRAKQYNVSKEAKSEEEERNRDLSLCPSFCSCSQNEQYVKCFQVGVESRRRSDLDLSLSVPGLLQEQKASFSSSISSAVSSEEEGRNVSMRKEDEEIDVEPYKLLVLRKDSFLQHLTKTVELKLKGGSMEEIEKESFLPLTLLQSLDLSNNFIMNITKETFSGLRSLHYLNLSCNRIEVLQGETFSHLMQLQHLELQYNNIRNVSRESFHGLLRLRHLNLEGNRIKMMEARTLIHLTQVTHLLVAHNHLASFDRLEILSPLIQTLDLSGNNLDRVPQGMHPFVRNLKLGRNSIRKILLDDWNNYGSISSIVLDHNLITQVQEDSFAHLQLLTSLSFLGNRLKDVPVNLPSNLRHLNLEGNEVTRLEKNSFRGLWILEHLQMGKNLIKVIDPNTFCDLLNLRSLHLEENQIEHFGSIFHNLSRLELLDLSGNPLKSLSSDSLYGLKALKQLGLNDLNSIQKSEIGENAFSYISSLSSLEMSNSCNLALEVLSLKHMKHLRSLKSIDLSGNNLTTLLPEFTTLCPDLQSVNMLNNRWNCTGDQVDWISNWLRNYPEVFIHPLNVTCFYPISLFGYPLMKFGEGNREGMDFPGKSHIIINHLSGRKSSDNLPSIEEVDNSLQRKEELTRRKNGLSSLSSPVSSSNSFLRHELVDQHQHVRRWSGASEKIGLKMGKEGRDQKDTSNIQDHSAGGRMDPVELEGSQMDVQMVGIEKERDDKRAEDESEEDERARSVDEGNEVRSMKSPLVVPSHSDFKTSSSSWHNPVLILCFTSLIPLSLIILLVIQGMNERISPSPPSVSCSNSEYVLYSASSQGDQISFVSSSYDQERDHQPLLEFNHDQQSGEVDPSLESVIPQQVQESSPSPRFSLLDSPLPSCSYSTCSSFHRQRF